MKLSQWNNMLSWVTDKGSLLESSGIIECHRFFYIFFDPEYLKERLLGTVDKTKSYHGKAIQINLSLNKGGRDNIDILPWFRGTDNSTYMTIGMYTYDIVSHGVVDVNERTDFILNEALLSSTTNDYDIKKSILNGVNVYSKDLRDKDDLKNSVQMSISSYSPNIPDPRFYTIKHQESIEDDIYCITSLSTSICHKGVDLLDDFTSISIMKTGDLDTLEPIMKSKIYNLRNSIKMSDYKLNMCDPTELSDFTMYHDFMSMQDGITYIYDSQMGSNIIRNAKSFTPFKKYQFDDKLQADIEQTLSLLKLYSKDVEKDFGSVRVMFTPKYFGDKTDIIFKDYSKDNQPILKNNMGIDNEFKIQNSINGALDGFDDNDSLSSNQ